MSRTINVKTMKVRDKRILTFFLIGISNAMLGATDWGTSLVLVVDVIFI